MQSLPGRWLPMSLVLDSSVASTWLYSNEIAEALRHGFDAIMNMVSVLWHWR
jgi:hypothetical protein